MTYDKNYFITKLSAIPDELWCSEFFSNGEARCALGHLGRFGWWRESREDRDVRGEEVNSFVAVLGNGDRATVERINNGDDLRYSQPTPKARILAALNDLP